MTADTVELRVGVIPDVADLVTLYDAVGWTAYTKDPDGLLRAVTNSAFVVTAWRGDVLVGLARCLSDDVAICYLQDILVRPDGQKTGLGRRLLEACRERYGHVRMTVLLTDDRPEQRAFYAAMGFCNTKDLERVTLNAFVVGDGVE